MSDISQRYEFALQQIVAESYLDKIELNADTERSLDEVIKRLTNGNNHYSLPEDKFTGATRMTPSQARDFLNHYEVIDQLPNTESGFSATLMRSKLDNPQAGIRAGEYTLAFRSTEYRSEKEGGDHKHDAQGADIDITFAGFAYAQLRDMEDYYAHLKQGKTLNPATKQWEPNAKLAGFKEKFDSENTAHDVLNVTGYSLGGHMATVFTEMHPDEIKQTYTFNAVGRGDFNADKYTLQEIQTKFWEVAHDPASHALKNISSNVITVGGDRSLATLYAEALAKQQSHPEFPAGDTYQDPRYLYAKEWAKATYGITHIASPGKTDLAPDADIKIIQSSGLATHGDLKIVADAGNHGSMTTDFFIEDQPNLEGSGGKIPQLTNPLTIVGGGDFGRTHSIVLTVDSLALMKTLEPMGNLSSTQLGALFAASSNERAALWAINRQTEHITESNSLENTLDSMRKLLHVKVTDANGHDIYSGKDWETVPDPKVGGFGNIVNREIFYTHLADLQTVIKIHPELKLQPLVDIDQFESNGEPRKNATPYSAANIAQLAKENTDEGLAWRYTLKNQTPFVVTGDPSIYNVHNQHGELNLHDVATRKGITAQEIDALAYKLEHQIHLNIHNLQDADTVAPASLKKILSESATPKPNNNDLTLPGLSAHAKNVDLFLTESGRPSVALEVIQQQIAMRLAMQEKNGVDLPAYLLDKQVNNMIRPHLG